MIYTCYEMIRDCREDRPAGWSYFISAFVPVIRRILEHYGDPAGLERVLVELRKPESSLFQSLDPAPERWFVAELRQKVLSEIPARDAATTIELETVAAALEPLTVTEKQAAWIETMGYTAADTGAMLRVATPTVEKIRERAAELLRGKVDSWNRGLLAENGRSLQREAAAAATKECLPSRAFLDILDGRATWPGREEIERHVSGCWHCIDHFSRMAEVVALLRSARPLTDDEAEPYRTLLGVKTGKPGRKWLPFAKS